jgi:hypothetical protein
MSPRFEKVHPASRGPFLVAPRPHLDEGGRRNGVRDSDTDRLLEHSAQYHGSGAVRSDGPVPFTIVFDHPRRHVGRRLWRSINSLLGSLLLLIGLTASIPAVPATLAVISFVLGWATTEPTDPEPWPSPDVPVREIVLAWAVTLPLAIGGVRVGLRLLRRNRTLVLFLRRFGYDDAQSAVAFAVLRTIGASWRVVTLDDAEMAPFGVTGGTRRVFRAGHLVSKYVLRLGEFLGLRMFPILISTMWGVLALGLIEPAYDFARTGVTTFEVWGDAIDPYVRIVGSVFEGRPPFDAVGPTLPGVFALLAMAAAVSFAVMIASMAALILAFPLSTVLFFLSSSADSIREAEGSKALTVNSVAEIQQAARDIARRSAKVFGPRLVVLRVASPVWQNAVSELASVSSLPLIDISEPTENVLWELEELTKRFGDKCVVIGHHEPLVALAALPSGNPGATRVERRLVELLEGREVLAYTTDRRGLKRFAAALRGLLLTRSA